MKKLILSVFALTSLNISLVNAQEMGQDFTVNAYQPGLASAGMNGNGTYRLYDYLDAGYTVIMDISATWCGPCWNYHLANHLDNVYRDHGPLLPGHPGVTGTSDDVMVIWIEGDGTTSDATMLDGAGSIGNWINPTGSHEIEFPMANPSSTLATQIKNKYPIGGYPTIFKICPNRQYSEIGQLSASALYAAASTCPQPASTANDPALLKYTGKNSACGPMDLKVLLQNNGTSNLTACTITVKEGATTIATYNWSGNLAKYGYQEVTVGQFTPTNPNHTLTFTITSSDDNAVNNVLTKSVSRAAVAASNNVTVKVDLDRYGSETSWKIKRSNGAVAYSSPTYTNASSNGTYPQPDINMFLADDCYTLELLDSYGDGFDGGYGNGKIEIWAGTTKVAEIQTFTGSSESTAFQLEAVASLIENTVSELSVYPNPASDVVNISFEVINSDCEVVLTDLQGRTVSTQSFKGANGNQQVQFATSELAKGSYIVSVKANGTVKTQNVVIK